MKDTTKTENSYRVIGITDRICEILKAVMLENKKEIIWNEMFRDRGFIFTNVVGSPLFKEKVNDIKTKGSFINKEKQDYTHSIKKEFMI